MFHTRKFLLIVLVLVFTVSSLRAQDQNTVTTDANARLRSGTGTTFDVIDIIPEGTEVSAVGRNDDASWIQVEYEGALGWISAEVITTSNDLDALPVVGAEETSDEPVATEVVVPLDGVIGINPDEINIRAEPSTNGDRLGQLPAESTIVLTGRAGAGEEVWVQFEFEGQEAWLASWLLEITGDVSTLSSVEPDEADLLAICESRDGVVLAANYTRGEGIHPVMLVNDAGRTHQWNGQLREWAPDSLSATELIACIGTQRERLIQTCPYYGPSILRYDYSIDVRLIAAHTGQTVDTDTLRGEPPRQCRQTEPYNLVRLDGTDVALAQVRDWLEPYVER